MSPWGGVDPQNPAAGHDGVEQRRLALSRQVRTRRLRMPGTKCVNGYGFVDPYAACTPLTSGSVASEDPFAVNLVQDVRGRRSTTTSTASLEPTAMQASCGMHAMPFSVPCWSGSLVCAGVRGVDARLQPDPFQRVTSGATRDRGAPTLL